MKQAMWVEILVMLLLCGCGSSGDEVIPVTGKLLVKGQPAVGARMFFHPQSHTVKNRGNGAAPTSSIAVVADDGSFVPTTYDPRDGLPAGEYAVTVLWPTIVVDQGEEQEGTDRLGRRYANIESPATKVQVTKPGPVVIPDLDLK